jgi:hypothetical protein
MKKYPERSPANSELRDAPVSAPLEFPSATDFESMPPRIELRAMLRRIEENLSWRNSRPGAEERRLAEKIPVEFVL